MAVNLVLIPKPDESGESMARRFKRAQAGAGLLSDMRRHLVALSKGERRRYKRQLAARRRAKHARQRAVALADFDRRHFREVD